MNTKTIIPLVLLAALLAGCAVSANQGSGDKVSKNEQRAAELDKVAAVIESGNFVFTVQTINPTGYRTVQATSNYTMKAENGEYNASLPYMGRAYQASYGGDGPIEFNSTPENLEIMKDTQKNSIQVSFSIAGARERYSIIFQVGYSGYGTLTVNSQNRQSISYYGAVSEPAGS